MSSISASGAAAHVVTEDDVVGLDLTAVAEWLHSTDGAEGPCRIRRIGNGQSNLTYLATDGAGRRRVLRRPPLGVILGSAHDVVREARVLHALRGTAVPVPAVVGITQDQVALGAPLVMMEFVEGLVLDRDEVVDATTTAFRHEVGLSLARTLAAVHGVDIRAAGLDDLASHSSYAGRQLRRWSGQWEASRSRELPALDDLTARLHDAAPDPGELCLVHGDLHLSNVMVDPTSAEIRAVLDWELCTLGDPLADLGTLLAYWPGEGEAGPLSFAASTQPGFVNRDELVDEYARATDRNVTALPFWHALALWKIAIICEGIIQRTCSDPRNRAQGGAPEPAVVESLVARAGQIMATADI